MRVVAATVLPLAVGMLCAAATASAQTRGDRGVTMGFPASVGFVAHVSDRLALRPELQLSFSTSETESPFQLTGVDNSLLGIGVSALIYIGDPDKLRTYVSPRYVFGRTEITSRSPFGDQARNRLESHTLIGSFGAQYSLHDRFSVFGEGGLGVTVDRRDSSLTPVHTDTTTVNTRTGVGIVFYF